MPPATTGMGCGQNKLEGKPFHYPEVLARLGALIRRSRGATVREEIRVGTLAIDRTPATAPSPAGRGGA